MNRSLFYTNNLSAISAFCLLLSLFSCRSTNYLTSIEASKQTINSELTLPSDSEITNLIQPYKIQLDQQMNQAIGTTAVDLKKKRPESTLGNWMADAIQRQTEKQVGHPIAFAIQNYGGIRIPEIKKGAINRGQIYELMPFDNTVIILSLDSLEVQELLQHIVQSGGWPVSHSIQVTQDSSEALAILLHEMPLQSDTLYQVALPDYVANGGSDSGFLKGKPQQKLALFIRDALIADVEAHTANNQIIESAIEGRIVLWDK